jgi:uncharacterized membrane protein
MPIVDNIQSNKQHAVPQNIMDVEFKLIGDLTMRQFAYLIVSGLCAYLASVFVVGLFKIPTMIFFALLGLGLAFVPIEERGMDEWIINFFKAIYSPTQRLWKKEPTIPSAFLYDNISVVKQELITLAPTSSRRKLEEYLKHQENNKEVDPLDIPEREYVLKLRDYYAKLAPPVPVASQAPVTPTNNTVNTVGTPSVALYEPIAEPVAPTPMPTPTSLPQQKPQPSAVSNAPLPTPVSVPTPVAQAPKPSVATPATAPVVQPVGQKTAPIKSEIQSKPETQVKQTPPQQPQLERQTVQVHEPTPAAPPAQHPQPRITFGEDVLLNTMTPDMHSGRRFTNLLPSQGELILPIRGERVININSEADADAEDDLRSKAERLNKLLQQIKAEESKRKPQPIVIAPVASVASKPTPAQPPSTPAAPGPAESPIIKGNHVIEMAKQDVASVNAEAEKLVTNLKSQNDSLAKEIAQLKEQLSHAASNASDTAQKEKTLKEMEAEKSKNTAEFAVLNKQITDLQNKLKEKKPEVRVESTPEPVAPMETTTTPLTTRPNVLAGTIMDPSNNPLPSAVVIVRNDKGEPVRAFKTNKLGQFVLSTPLSNGRYTMEISPVNDYKFSFDIISIEAKGEAIPTILLKGKQ